MTYIYTSLSKDFLLLIIYLKSKILKNYALFSISFDFSTSVYVFTRFWQYIVLYKGRIFSPRIVFYLPSIQIYSTKAFWKASLEVVYDTHNILIICCLQNFLDIFIHISNKNKCPNRSLKSQKQQSKSNLGVEIRNPYTLS